MKQFYLPIWYYFAAYLELLEVVPLPVGENALPGIAIIKSPSSPSVSGRVSLYDLFFVPGAGGISGTASSTTGSVKYSRAFPIRMAEPFFKLISAALPYRFLSTVQPFLLKQMRSQPAS